MLGGAGAGSRPSARSALIEIRRPADISDHPHSQRRPPRSSPLSDLWLTLAFPCPLRVFDDRSFIFSLLSSAPGAPSSSFFALPSSLSGPISFPTLTYFSFSAF